MSDKGPVEKAKAIKRSIASAPAASPIASPAAETTSSPPLSSISASSLSATVTAATGTTSAPPRLAQRRHLDEKKLTIDLKIVKSSIDPEEMIEISDDPAELCDLGQHYFFQGNLEEAIHYFKMAANKGYAEGQFKAGQCYEHGWGTVQNIPKALYLYSMAAEQSHQPAQKSYEKLSELRLSLPKEQFDALEPKTPSPP